MIRTENYFSGSARPREAEALDSRLDFTHTELVYGRRRRDMRDNSSFRSPDDTDQDRATVSITALILFLENYLISKFDSSEDRVVFDLNTQALAPSSVPEIAPDFPDSRSARAAKAYASMSRLAYKTPVGNIPVHQPPTLKERQRRIPELKTVQNLIAELKFLAQEEVGQIRIERGESFLDSLIHAVDAAKRMYNL